MDKFKTWAKRPVNNNFILLLIVVLFLVLMALSYFLKLPITAKIEKFAEIMDSFFRERPAGFEKIIDSIEKVVYRVGSIGDFILKFQLFYIPMFIAVIVFVQTIFARIIFSNKSDERLICYRIFMAITLITTSGLCVGYSLFFFYSLTTGFISVVADAFLVYIVITCIKNTYTKRIKE